MTEYLKLLNTYDDISCTVIPPTKHVFENHIRIIGKAGIGKSTYIKEQFQGFEYLRFAYTGISAAQINSKTLSSAFKLFHFFPRLFIHLLCRLCSMAGT